MRRTTYWLWLSGGVLGGATIAIFGGWWALRQWPEVVGPRLPPSLAYALAGVGSQEASAARTCFGDFSDYWFEHEMTPAMAEARNAVLCAELRGSREQQLAALDFIGSNNVAGAHTGFVEASPERDALVFALTSSPDQDMRVKARACWQRNGPSPLTTLRWLHLPDVDDRSPLSPDGWSTDTTGATAWHMLIPLNYGYDHVTPNKYQKHQQGLLGRLLAADANELWAKDPRTHAIVLLVMAEAFAMTNDPQLKPAVEHGLRAFLRDPAHLERLWVENTTTAVLLTLNLNPLLASGLDAEPVRSSLFAGLDAWLVTRDETGIPSWFSQGRSVAATSLERWAALMIGLDRLGRQPTAPAMPPTGIGDPHDCTPVGRYLIRLVTSNYSTDPAWARVFDQRTETLQARRLIAPDHQPPEGSWPATATISSHWETTFALLELCTERYRSPPTWTPYLVSGIHP